MKPLSARRGDPFQPCSGLHSLLPPGLCLLLAGLLAACVSGGQAPPRYGPLGPYGTQLQPPPAEERPPWSAAAPPPAQPGPQQRQVKDANPALWRSEHLWVRHFRRYYLRTRTVKRALQRGAPYLPFIQRVFRQQGLPQELIYLPMLESLYDVHANSGRAVGMWQFTRQTARHMGLRVGHGIDERRQWRKATRAAARYLDELGRRFHYDWGLALAAYNCGPGCVARAMRTQRKRSFFQLRFRKETNEYVPRFLAMLQVAQTRYPELLLASR